jgi:hypothetical protein
MMILLVRDLILEYKTNMEKPQPFLPFGLSIPYLDIKGWKPPIPSNSEPILNKSPNSNNVTFDETNIELTENDIEFMFGSVDKNDESFFTNKDIKEYFEKNIIDDKEIEDIMNSINNMPLEGLELNKFLNMEGTKKRKRGYELDYRKKKKQKLNRSEVLVSKRITNNVRCDENLLIEIYKILKKNKEYKNDFIDFIKDLNNTNRVLTLNKIIKSENIKDIKTTTLLSFVFLKLNKNIAQIILMGSDIDQNSKESNEILIEHIKEYLRRKGIKRLCVFTSERETIYKNNGLLV